MFVGVRRWWLVGMWVGGDVGGVWVVHLGEVEMGSGMGSMGRRSLGCEATRRRLEGGKFWRAGGIMRAVKIT